MVAEGRVWEFYCSEGSQNPCPQQELYRWQFSGTAEKDGRTWNRLMRVGSVKWRGSDPESGVVDDTATGSRPYASGGQPGMGSRQCGRAPDEIPGTERCAATFPEVEFKPESRG